MRSLALDVHQSFCEVAVCEQGKVRSSGRVKSERSALELFAESLDSTDQVVMEATGPAMEIARIIEPHVARVVVANAQDVRAISHARVKSDRFDARTLAKNEVHATLARCLLGRSPVADLFGKGGRAWLGRQDLPAAELETVAGCLRQIDFLSEEIEAIEAKLCEWVSASPEAKRLMTIPGLGVASAAALMAAIGDISRFPSPRKHSGVAAVAVARKIACLCWQLLTKEENYAFGRPSLVRAKLRRAELSAGGARLPKRHGGRRISATPKEREAERELVERAEAAYRRLVADWHSTGAKGAGATDGRASSGPSTGQAARQAKAPGPAL
jgi:transposase